MKYLVKNSHSRLNSTSLAEPFVVALTADHATRDLEALQGL